MRYRKALSDELIKLLDDISAYRDINNDFPNRDFEEELLELENLALKLFKLKLSKHEGYSKVRVAVIGSFSSGKSSFINSILGADVCPVKVNPSTSSVTEFVYGDSEEVFLIEEDGTARKITREEYHSLCQHKVESIETSKAYFFEYRYPSPVLKNIVLYDTPGFDNEKNPRDEEITVELAIKHADVILFVQDIQKGTLEKSVIERIEKLKSLSAAKEWYLIFNKADSKSKAEINRIREHVESIGVDQFFNGVYFYSAKKVLEVIRENNDDSLASFKDWLVELKEGTFDLILKKERAGSDGKRYLSRLSSNKFVKNYMVEISVADGNSAQEKKEDGVFRFKLSNLHGDLKYMKEREKIIGIFREISLRKDEYINEKIYELSKVYGRKKEEVLGEIKKALKPELFYSEYLNNLLEQIDKGEIFKFPKKAANSLELVYEIPLALILDFMEDYKIPEKYKQEIVDDFRFSIDRFLSQINKVRSEEASYLSNEDFLTYLEVVVRLILLNTVRNILNLEKRSAKLKVDEISRKIDQVLNG